MKIKDFFRCYGIETLMLLGSIGLGTWFSIPHEYTHSNKVSDTLRVVTLYGPMTFFEHLGDTLGEEYLRVRMLSESMKKPLKITILSSLEEIHQAITSGKADLSITPEAVNDIAKKQFAFVGPEHQSAMVLVQQKRHYLDKNQIRIHDVTDLLGKSVYVLNGSRYEQRLKTLSDQLGGAIYAVDKVPDSLKLLDSLPTDDLIKMVSLRQIDYAVVDQELAKVAERYYLGVDMSLVIGFPQIQRWIVHRENTNLIKDIHNWSENTPSIPPTRRHIIYRKYLEAHSPHHISSSGEYRGEKTHITPGRISPFDGLFKAEAPRLGWRWEILASIAYQESNFIPDIIGQSGARGLMGIMPRTGRSFGASPQDLLDPQVSVRVSVDCLLAFGNYFQYIEETEQRIKLTLAAYNAGIAHIQDAQRLAQKYGADPNRWDNNVDEYIRLKSDPKYYKDPVCKYGYLRGIETYNYVNKVISRANMYKTYTAQTVAP